MDRHTTLVKSDSAAKTTESFVKRRCFLVRFSEWRREDSAYFVAARCRNRSEIRADADAQGLSYAEHGIRCHGNAQTDAEGK